MSVVGVVGGGPAGATFATRMVQLDHDVWLAERAPFPRRHLGEALTPGVLPLLEVTGARAAVEAEGFRPVPRVRVTWEAGPQLREDPRREGLIVDRGAFDRALLDRAKELGVQVLQPATVRARHRSADGWSVEIDTADGARTLQADFMADATGRQSGRLPGRSPSRGWTGAATLAIHAYWQGGDLPDEPMVEAGDAAWYWGVPLPDDTYNTLVFVDARTARGQGGTLTERFMTLLSRSSLLAGCRDVALAGPVSAINATPYLDRESATPTLLKVGDAALALDPLSSSGVQKAVQGALSSAIVANTLLRRPASTEAALQFYRDSLAEASARHSLWTAEHYGRIAAHGGGAFWQDRSLHATGHAPAARPAAQRVGLDADALRSTAVALSGEIEFVDQPCIDDQFVALQTALRHPALDGAIAYLGGQALVPLLRGLPAGLTPLQIARSWSDRVPLDRGLAIAGWMLDRGLLVPHGPDAAGSTRPLTPRTGWEVRAAASKTPDLPSG